MKVTKDVNGYVLKHESGRYYTGCCASINVYLTDEPLMATRFSTRELAEQAIANAKMLIAVASDGVPKSPCMIPSRHAL